MFISVILSRWLHVVSACLAIGGVFFIRFIVPRGLSSWTKPSTGKFCWPCAGISKWWCIPRFFFCWSRAFTTPGWHGTNINLDKAVLHALWGTHILLAGLAITISLYVLAGPQPPRSHRKLMAINFAILLLAVAAASSLKWAPRARRCRSCGAAR